jgi:flagellar motility protein MotE (MotC chaperone)
MVEGPDTLLVLVNQLLASGSTFLALVIGPGSGVWIALRGARREQRRDAAETNETLRSIEAHLRELNGRVERAEGGIVGLVERERDGNGR